MSARHILMVADATGGVWTHVMTLARGLARDQWRVSLAVMGPPPFPAQAEEAAQAHCQLHVTGLPLEWLDPEGASVECARRQLLGLAARLRPHIIHLHSYRECLFRWDAPVILTAHSCVRSWWLACRGEEPPAEWQGYSARVQAALQTADHWIAPSQSFGERMQQLYDPPLMPRIIRNGSDAVPQASPWRSGIFASGRLWDEAKNFSLLARASEGTGEMIRLAGPLASPSAASRFGVPAHMRWLGTLSAGQMRQAHGGAALYCSPARYEPFGLGVLEAARSGAGLLLSAIPAHLELWDGAATFFDPDDAGELHALIKGLARRPDLIAGLQAAARERARSYSAEAMCAAHAALYAQALGQRP